MLLIDALNTCFPMAPSLWNANNPADDGADDSGNLSQDKAKTRCSIKYSYCQRQTIKK